MHVDRQFADALASSAPTPGGGGASAYVGALAAALAQMVANLTIGKPGYEHLDGQLKEKLLSLRQCQDILLDLVHEDAEAFNALVATWRMPKETPQQLRRRREAEEKALCGACEIPLKTMRVCAKVIELLDLLAHKGSHLVVADAGASAMLAKGALKAASLNVYINTSMMHDAAVADGFEAEADDLVSTFGYQADVIFDYVLHEVKR